MSDTLLDRDYLFSEFGDDPDLAEIIEMFVNDMPDRLVGLARCVAAGDWQELGRLAHQLKGACGSYGFHQLTTPAARLELACRTDHCSEGEIRAAAESLIELCGRVRAGTAS